MEQTLVDKLINGTLDDIDEDMIVARLHNVNKQIEGALEQISKSIQALSDICDNHKEEVVLLGLHLSVPLMISHRRKAVGNVGLMRKMMLRAFIP